MVVVACALIAEEEAYVGSVVAFVLIVGEEACAKILGILASPECLDLSPGTPRVVLVCPCVAT